MFSDKRSIPTLFVIFKFFTDNSSFLDNIMLPTLKIPQKKMTKYDDKQKFASIIYINTNRQGRSGHLVFNSDWSEVFTSHLPTIMRAERSFSTP